VRGSKLICWLLWRGQAFDRRKNATSERNSTPKSQQQRGRRKGPAATGREGSGTFLVGTDKYRRQKTAFLLPVIQRHAKGKGKKPAGGSVREW